MERSSSGATSAARRTTRSRRPTRSIPKSRKSSPLPTTVRRGSSRRTKRSCTGWRALFWRRKSWTAKRSSRSLPRRPAPTSRSSASRVRPSRRSFPALRRSPAGRSDRWCRNPPESRENVRREAKHESPRLTPDALRVLMSFAETFLEEFDTEMAATRKMLERVPAASLDWKPHTKSKSLGELATHVTELPRFGLRIRSDADFLARFDENVREAREAIAAMSEEDLSRDFTVTRGGQVFFTLKKRFLLRRVLLNHLIHHRGQLSVYLRLNDVPLPAIYGPTADEES